MTMMSNNNSNRRCYLANAGSQGLRVAMHKLISGNTWN